MIHYIKSASLVIFMFMLASCVPTSQATISFHTGSGNAIDEIIYDGQNPVAMPDDPEKEGYTFLGWYTDPQREIPYTFDPTPKADVTLYAKWQINQYTVTFETQMEIELPNQTFDYLSILNVPMDLVRDQHVLIGWFFDEALSQPFNLERMPAQHLTLYAKWQFIPEGLPILHIDLTNHELSNVNREVYVDSRISLTNTFDEFLLDQVPAEFRGRGNGSWVGYEKKGYRIKFESKVGLFGEASSRHWVIVAGGHDRSAIRNHVAYTLIHEVLDAIEYQTSVHLVEVYVNGNYHGVYSLFEHVRVNKDRVAITSEFGILDTGYLIEYDAYARGIEGIDFFRVPGLKYPFTVKSPDPDDYDAFVSTQTYRAQVAFIRNYMIDVYQAIFNQNFERLEQLVDVDSMVDMYIIHELFKNTDTGWSSFYLYKKPGDKLFFGPAWDFDFTAGISRGDSSYAGLYVSDRILTRSAFTSSEMYIELMKQPIFVNLVKDRYLEVADLIEQQIGEIFDDIFLYHEAFERDGIRWDINHNWRNEQLFVRTWLYNRNDWLKAWATNRS